MLQEELATLESNLRELAGEEGSLPSLVALYEPSAGAIPEAARRAQNKRELSQLSDSAHLLQQRHSELTGQMTHLQTTLQQKQGAFNDFGCSYDFLTVDFNLLIKILVNILSSRIMNIEFWFFKFCQIIFILKLI